ncbi:MAG TPA: 50S ribosomal protein L11 methyltransferase [Thermoanaerobaculia bacterium]|nr:50S ribosomal protein L11 methyltransferase [Thermoanaerobaculia bacterium]
MSRPIYSRLVIPRKARDDAIVGLVSQYAPLGFSEEGRDLVACFRSASAARDASLTLAASRIACELTTDIPEGDPFTSFREASRPFPVGRRFWIDPGDPSDSRSPAGRIPLRLPASRAFGTGSHESTRLALMALEEGALEGLAVLDVGTGSAVLALAAAALGARCAVGCDTDFEAVAVARGNLRLHPFGERVTLVVAAPAALRGAFPLIVANLLPEEFLPIERSVAARLASSGRLILSGIPLAGEPRLLARLRAKRWRLTGRLTEGEWSCVCLERAS